MSAVPSSRELGASSAVDERASGEPRLVDTERVPPPPSDRIEPASIALEQELLSRPVPANAVDEGTPAAPAVTPPPAAVALATLSDSSAAPQGQPLDMPSPQSVELARKLEHAA